MGGRMTDTTNDRPGAEQWRASLAERILSIVNAGVDGSPDVFDILALEVFEYQYANNEPYRHYCDAAGATPDSVRVWSDIPAYPTDAFKSEVVASFETEKAVQAIMTSGTTRPNQRGRIFRDETGQRLIFTANRIMTGAYLFPDFEAGRRCRILLMTPGLDIAPTMGMAIGMDQTRQHFGTEDSMFLVKRSGVDVKALVRALRESEESGTPIALIGATSAFVYFFNACRDKKMRFALPEGSRVCDGGGYRGRFGAETEPSDSTAPQRVPSFAEQEGLLREIARRRSQLLGQHLVGHAAVAAHAQAPPRLGIPIHRVPGEALLHATDDGRGREGLAAACAMEGAVLPQDTGAVTGHGIEQEPRADPDRVLRAGAGTETALHTVGLQESQLGDVMTVQEGLAGADGHAGQAEGAGPGVYRRRAEGGAGWQLRQWPGSGGLGIQVVDGGEQGLTLAPGGGETGGRQGGHGGLRRRRTLVQPAHRC